MPSSTHVCSAMIAHGADHERLQFIVCHLIGKPIRVDDGVVMAARIRAVDEELRVPERPLIRQRHRLIGVIAPKGGLLG
jgi:hypothetical protein